MIASLSVVEKIYERIEGHNIQNSPKITLNLSVESFKPKPFVGLKK
jgi:hypothetical protein